MKDESRVEVKNSDAMEVNLGAAQSPPKTEHPLKAELPVEERLVKTVGENSESFVQDKKACVPIEDKASETSTRSREEQDLKA